jgi:hypothetical protein
MRLDNQVTYLTGAGASFYALPIVKDIPERYDIFLGTIIEMVREKYGEIVEEPENLIERDDRYFAFKLLWYSKRFREGIHNHSSVDTYAKKLYLQKSEQLNAYKFCLSCFLMFEQIVKGPDQRYDTFFASILKNDIRDFPKNVNVVSWNYDTQFEISYGNYLQRSNLYAIKKELNILTKSDLPEREFEINKFNIVKLNGTIGLVSSSEQDIGYVIPDCYAQSNPFDRKDFENFLTNFKHLKTSNSQPLLSFAWEKDLGSKIIVNEAVLATQRTKTLVIIGYSFPYFNRAIDRSLFDGMQYLSKIYIQDPNASNMVQMVNELCNHLPEREKIEIVPFTETSQFLIPNELV